MTHNDEISENDAVLVAQAGARQDHRREARIGQVNGDPRRYEHGVARMDFYRALDARAQVKASRAGGRVMRRAVVQTWVEESDVDSVHGVFLMLAIVD